MDEKTGAQLDDHEVRTYLEFAGERACISKDEMVRRRDARRWLLAHALRGRRRRGGNSREDEGGGGACRRTVCGVSLLRGGLNRRSVPCVPYSSGSEVGGDRGNLWHHHVFAGSARWSGMYPVGLDLTRLFLID